MKNNCALSNCEMQFIRLRDEAECTELFGPEYVKEFGSHVPPELILRYKAAYAAMVAVDAELNEYNELRYK